MRAGLGERTDGAGISRRALRRVLRGAMLAWLLTLPFSTALAAGELPWQAKYELDHPLLGQWLDRRAAPLDLRADHAMLADSEVVFLGETHGHPDHHAKQLEILKTLSRLHGTFRVGFEIFDLADQPVLDALYERGETDVDVLGEELGMADRPWPWDDYRPLVAYALAHGLPIVALNLSSEQVRAVIEEGMEALPEQSSMGVHLKVPDRFDERTRLTWRDDMIDAHCGHLPADAAEAMLNGQQARDAVMAERLAATAPPMVAIMGSEHARLDRGVPVWLALLKPDWRLTSLGLSQVDPDRGDAEAYAPRAARFDALWLAPRQYQESACERFREQLEKMREGRDQHRAAP